MVNNCLVCGSYLDRPYSTGERKYCSKTCRQIRNNIKKRLNKFRGVEAPVTASIVYLYVLAKSTDRCDLIEPIIKKANGLGLTLEDLNFVNDRVKIDINTDTMLSEVLGLESTPKLITDIDSTVIKEIKYSEFLELAINLYHRTEIANGTYLPHDRVIGEFKSMLKGYRKKNKLGWFRLKKTDFEKDYDRLVDTYYREMIFSYDDIVLGGFYL